MPARFFAHPALPALALLVAGAAGGDGWVRVAVDMVSPVRRSKPARCSE